MNQVTGCTLSSLLEDACREWIGWVSGERMAPPEVEDFPWLLAHCDDGVVWGWHDSKGAGWRLSSQVFPDLSPPILVLNLRELRLFGPQAEVLIWRAGDGFQGRILREKADISSDDPARPADEDRVLLGDRIVASGQADGFTRVGDGKGAEQAVPLKLQEKDFLEGRWPLRLKIRHYVETDRDTGILRVVATRLVSLFCQEVK